MYGVPGSIAHSDTHSLPTHMGGSPLYAELAPPDFCVDGLAFAQSKAVRVSHSALRQSESHRPTLAFRYSRIVTAMSDDAAAKREARKRRILEKSRDRLSRITNTGRGKDYEGLDTKPIPAMPSPGISDTADTLTGPTPSAALKNEEPPAHDASDPFTSMMAAMQSRMGAQEQGSGASRGADGSNDSNMPSDPMALMQQLLSGSGMQQPGAMNNGAGDASNPQTMVQVKEARRIERSVRRVKLLQATLVFLFAFYIVFSSIFSHAHDTGLTGRSIPTESMSEFSRESFQKQWASLAWEYTPISAWLSKDDPSVFPWGALRTPLDSLRPYIGHETLGKELPSWPIFWVFVSMEMGLQGVRLAMLQRMPVSLPGGLKSVISVYAPSIQRLLTPALTLLSLASSLVDDLCILLFAIGTGVLFCHVRTDMS